MSVLKVENLSKYFGNFKALDNVNIEVNKGEIFGFIGPNGAGKSTTIRIILGILNKSDGNVSVFNEDININNISTHQKIAYVPGDVGLWPNLTGGEVIDLFLSFKNESNDKLKQQLIKDFQFDPTKKCRTYSKGNRQKVAIIAALCSKAELYIFDEPTNGLDPLMIAVFHKYLNELKENNKAILLSSHDLSEVEKMCDRISIIKDGKIVESGTMEDLRNYTKNKVNISFNKKPTGLSKLKYLTIASNDNNDYVLFLDSKHISDFISFINDLEVTKLEILPASLEELFMTHYKAVE